MKIILYVIAIIIILTGSWFSFSTMNKFTVMQDERIEMQNQNLTRNAYIIKTKKEAKDMEAERDQVKASLIEADAELLNVVSKIKTGKRQSSDWSRKIAEQDRQLKETEDVIVSIKKAFNEIAGDVGLAEVPALVDKLENDVKTANRDFEEKQELANAAEKKLASNEEEIVVLRDRVQKRKQRIAGNKAEGRITAADHNWGFAVINVPDNMPIENTTKLIVKRGADFIGKVSVNAIEGKRVIADIDYGSMKPGMVVQAGDAVILAKPVAN